MNRDVCEHSTPVDLPCDKCHVANRGGHIAVAMSRIADLEAQRDALLEALRDIVDAADGTGWDQLDASFSKARAAIGVAEGEKQ